MGSPKWLGNNLNFQVNGVIVVSPCGSAPPFGTKTSRKGNVTGTGNKIFFSSEPINTGQERNSNIVSNNDWEQVCPSGEHCPSLAISWHLLGTVTSLQKALPLLCQASCFRMVGSMTRPVNSVHLGQVPHFFCWEVSSYTKSNIVWNAMTVDKAFCKSIDSILAERQLHIHSKYLFQEEKSAATFMMEAVQCNQPATRQMVYHSSEWCFIGVSVLVFAASRMDQVADHLVQQPGLVSEPFFFSGLHSKQAGFGDTQ